jgi:ubiquinone/menaquinone biosynthesis C-methylase UbiE
MPREHDDEILRARLEKTEIPATYRRVARVYDTWGRLTESHARRRSLDLAAIKDGESVLEVAVGTGLAFSEILKTNPSGRNVGIDLTDAMLARARRKAAETGHANYELSVGDAYHLDSPTESFDVLVNHYMFDLLPEAAFHEVLTGFRRVLRPGGRLSVVNMTLPRVWYEASWQLLYRIHPKTLGGCRGVELTTFLERTGFEVLRREHFSQMTFPSEVILALKPEGYIEPNPGSDVAGVRHRSVVDEAGDETTTQLSAAGTW